MNSQKAQERMNTIDSYHDKGGDYSDHSYNDKDLEFRYRALQHQYSMLENEFQLYSSETYNRIINFQRDMDVVLREKDSILLALSNEKKLMEEENKSLRNRIHETEQNAQKLQQQWEKRSLKLEEELSKIKQSMFLSQKSEVKHREIVLNFERELEIKISQIENLKDIINNQRMNTLSKDQLIHDKQSQIAQLASQIKSLSLDLQSQKEIHSEITESNFKLKLQVNELKNIFHELEAGIRHCHSCKILDERNQQLEARIRSMIQKENKKYSYSITKPQKQKNKYLFDYGSKSKQSYQKKYIPDISVDSMNIRVQTNSVQKSMRDSVVRRCRIQLNKN